MNEGRLRILVFDDQEIVRLGLAQAFGRDDRIEVVSMPTDVSATRTEIARTHPDVVTLEIMIPLRAGLELIRCVADQDETISIVVVSSLSHPSLVSQARSAGASAYFDKAIPVDDLLEGIVEVRRSSAFDWSALEAVERLVPEEDALRLGTLTARERQMLRAIGKGKINRQIAEELRLTEKTVKNYVSHLLQKLGMHSRAEVAALAGRLDLAEHPTVPRCDWNDDLVRTSTVDSPPVSDARR